MLCVQAYCACQMSNVCQSVREAALAAVGREAALAAVQRGDTPKAHQLLPQ